MLSTEDKEWIKAQWAKRPIGISYPPASEEELQDFEETHQTIPEDYRWFLKECGSGVVGSEWLNGIDDLFSSHTKFREECSIPNGWKCREMFLIAWDGSGSPMGLLPTGEVVVEHEGADEIQTLSPSLADYLKKGLAE